MLPSFPPRITEGEFRDRQDRARSACLDRGLSGAIFWSRGGSTQDRYADVFYLANYYTHFPLFPDEAGRWSARGHTALVVPVDGPSCLVVDQPAFRDDLAVADETVTGDDVIQATAEAAGRLIPNGQIGLVGAEGISAQWHEYISTRLDGRMRVTDEIGSELRLLKSDAELALLRSAGALGSRAVDAMMASSLPGATEAEVAAAGFSTVLNGGGMVYGLSISAGPYAHTYSQSQPAPFESRREIEPGDMIRVDFYGSVDGYLFDFGRSRVVGRSPTDDQQALIDAATESVLAGIAAVKPGVSMKAVAAACDETFAESEYSRRGIGLPPAFSSWGHSLGLCWERPWIDADSETVIEPGMCLAIEKRVAAEHIGGVTYEDNLIVTDGGCDVTTDSRRDYS